jgi:hypothetical protein
MILDVTLPASLDDEEFSDRLDVVCADLGVTCSAYLSEADIL